MAIRTATTEAQLSPSVTFRVPHGRKVQIKVTPLGVRGRVTRQARCCLAGSDPTRQRAPRGQQTAQVLRVGLPHTTANVSFLLRCCLMVARKGRRVKRRGH